MRKNVTLITPLSLPHITIGEGGWTRTYFSKDLPQPGSFSRWTPLRRLVFARAVEGGLISREVFLTRYGVASSEFDSWSKTEDAETQEPRNHVQHCARSKSIVLRSGKVRLTEIEYQLFRYFRRYSNQVVCKRLLIIHLYGVVTRATERRLIVYMTRLRKKLSSEGSIESEWGRGYIFRTPSEETLAVAA